MPRSPRFCPPGYPVHVIQRGNNRQAIFTSNKDVGAYAHWLAEGSARFGVAIHGWVFMTNHVHLLATPADEYGVSHLMQYLGRLYVRYFNYAYSRSGTLFEGRFRSCLVQESRYLLTCLRYIELNPVRAGLVRYPGEYRWSSYQVHSLGVKAQLWTPHQRYLNLGESGKTRQRAWCALVSDSLEIDVLAKIRQCANTGLVLGTETFRNQVRRLRK